MTVPRGLSAEEAAAWARLAQTVTPLVTDPVRAPPRPPPPVEPPKSARAALSPTKGRVPAPLPPKPAAAAPRTLERHGLDASWERKLARAALEPDFTLDLHGASLAAAHARLDHGLAQARALGARLVLVVTGKPRPADPADRGQRRGAIRAQILDWLAAGPHEGDIAAVRGAHRRHGGAGALYIVLRRKPSAR